MYGFISGAIEKPDEPARWQKGWLVPMGMGKDGVARESVYTKGRGGGGDCKYLPFSDQEDAEVGPNCLSNKRILRLPSTCVSVATNLL